MTWSYSKDPAASTRDAVRFLVGDTDETDKQLENEEIDYLITTYGAAAPAALAAARGLVARYSRLVSKAVGDLRVDYSDRATNYRALVEELVVITATAGGVPIPYAGGISEAAKDADQGDTDVPERFQLGFTDHNTAPAAEREVQ